MTKPPRLCNEEKRVFSVTAPGQTGVPPKPDLDLDFIPETNITPKWIMDLNIWVKIITLSEENTEVYFVTSG